MLSKVACFSLLLLAPLSSFANNANGAPILHCIQTAQSNPVYDLTVRPTPQGWAGDIAANAVPLVSIRCGNGIDGNGQAGIKCASSDGVTTVWIGSSGVAHVFQNGQDLTVLPCIGAPAQL